MIFSSMVTHVLCKLFSIITRVTATENLKRSSRFLTWEPLITYYPLILETGNATLQISTRNFTISENYSFLAS